MDSFSPSRRATSRVSISLFAATSHFRRHFRHGIVRHRDQDAVVTFVDEFQHGAGRENRDIIAMRLNGRQHFSPVRLPRPLSFYGSRDIVRHLTGAAGYLLIGRRKRHLRRLRHRRRRSQKLPSIHTCSPFENAAAVSLTTLSRSMISH